MFYKMKIRLLKHNPKLIYNNRKLFAKKHKKYSYGDFLRNNPKASRKERLSAIKNFLNNTR